MIIFKFIKIILIISIRNDKCLYHFYLDIHIMTHTKSTFTKLKYLKKEATLIQVNIIIYPQEKKYHDEPIDKNAIDGLTTLTSFTTSERLKNRETQLNESYPRILPQWVKYDHKVKFPY